MKITENLLRRIIRAQIIKESFIDSMTPPAQVVGHAISDLLNSPELAEKVAAAGAGSDPDVFVNDVLRFTKVSPFRTDLDKLSHLISNSEPTHRF